VIAGAGVQAAQAASGIEAERFEATGASTQPAQTGVGAAIERFIVTGAGAQAAQSAAGAGLEEFAATGGGVQRAQTAAGDATERFIVAGATAQAAQTGAGQASGPFAYVIDGATAQARQTADGTATSHAIEVAELVDAVPGGGRGGALIENQVIPFRRRLEANGAGQQRRQRGAGTAFVHEHDEAVLGLDEQSEYALLGIAA
jgi:hypothetical protein